MLKMITSPRMVAATRLAPSIYCRPLQIRNFITGAPLVYKVTRKLNYPVKTMFQVVADVSKYKEFVPFIEDSFVNNVDASGNPSEAGLKVGWNHFDETFTCQLECKEDEVAVHNDQLTTDKPKTQSRVKAESISMALFDHLSCEWKFSEAPEGKFVKDPACEVELLLSYKFKNPLYQAASASFNESAAKIMIKAFEKRAREIHIKE